VIVVNDRVCDAQDLAGEVKAVGGRLMMLFATGEPAGSELCAIVAAPGGVVSLRADITAGSYPALTPTISAAHWFERELHDLYGIVPESHPRLEPLVRHEPDRGELLMPEPDDFVPEHRGASPSNTWSRPGARTSPTVPSGCSSNAAARSEGSARFRSNLRPWSPSVSPAPRASRTRWRSRTPSSHSPKQKSPHAGRRSGASSRSSSASTTISR
jgi:Respiratory-chain NADH dehydrogenase, 30 Kd subunit